MYGASLLPCGKIRIIRRESGRVDSGRLMGYHHSSHSAATSLLRGGVMVLEDGHECTCLHQVLGDQCVCLNVSASVSMLYRMDEWQRFQRCNMQNPYIKRRTPCDKPRTKNRERMPTIVVDSVATKNNKTKGFALVFAYFGGHTWCPSTRY